MTHEDQEQTVLANVPWGYPKRIILGTRADITQEGDRRKAIALSTFADYDESDYHTRRSWPVDRTIYYGGHLPYFLLYIVVVGDQLVHLAIKDLKNGNQRDVEECIDEVRTLVYCTPSSELYCIHT